MLFEFAVEAKPFPLSSAVEDEVIVVDDFASDTFVVAIINEDPTDVAPFVGILIGRLSSILLLVEEERLASPLVALSLASAARLFSSMASAKRSKLF